MTMYLAPLSMCEKYEVQWTGKAENRKKEVLVAGFKERIFGSSDFSAEQTLISALAQLHHWELRIKQHTAPVNLGGWN